MIIISGAPLDISAISGAYPENSVQRQLLGTMSASGEKYQYDSLNQLKFELNLRNEIVNAARALYKSQLNFAGFHDSRCNPEFWDRTRNGGFTLKSGAKPGEAITDIFINGGEYATECATAMVIVYYKALLSVYGNELFDKLFPKIYLMNWNVPEPLLRDVSTPKKAADVLLGDRGYFINPDVNPATPEWQGENVIVLPDSLYYGHGIGMTTADKIIRALNLNRKEGATQSAYFLDSVGRPNFKKLSDASGTASSSAAPRTGSLVWRPFPAPITPA
ncbi:MAG: protein-glutamine gamma-glutamyltransferase [Oscillospiraceae bacterium]|jgi:protein-glutamine gamma-glutamyltransferase|nr:protein-glutamine gamma-glutamyltransferase [Oscillospiraceae bacterium]